ncbi:hypothetical protein [Cohnella nanjingensis]|uniref:Extracellular solute-binding protein n=1 Tax=Cohnella nanjingensis TaxID=1387779 RepID=A0A7X0RYD2_9BACL|nr:hypothetical protein [Cohnella nanjingensis]MBB6674731.1 hypothetical protein [Cohnella nanjingensis]
MSGKLIRLVTGMVCTAMLGGMLIGCSDSAGNAGESAPASKGSGGETQLLDGGVTNATGYPIAATPITLNVGILYGAHMGDFTKYEIWKKIEEKTNIKINLKVYSDVEKVNLMFSSRDYPDIMLRMDPSPQAISDAVDAKDIVGVDNLLQYAPNWSKFFESNPDLKRQALMPDGKLYGFPYVAIDEYSYNLRDQWLINRKWLDELGLKIPTTTEEFKSVLMAFKENAGKGSIPKNVTPYYIQYGNNIGGQFDLYGSFGVYTPGSYFIVEDGKFKSQATNPDLKEPIRYLADLYKNGLIVPEAFTDDWGKYTAAISSSPPIVGSMTSYNDQNENYMDGKWWYPMAPLQSPNGKQPLIRRQTRSIWPRNFVIFKNNKYPVASARLADMLAEPEWSMTMNYGKEGAAWTQTADGKYQLTNQKIDAEADKGLGNYGIALLDENMFKNNIVNENVNKEGTREWAYDHIYKKALPAKSLNYPPVPAGLLNDMEKQRLLDLDKAINDYIKTTVAGWIAGKNNVDDDWDAYVKKLDSLGLDEYMQLNQKQLDAASQLGK